MRIGKKLFSCLALFLLCILCLLADAPKVRAAEFLTADDGTFLYMNSRELEISDEEDLLETMSTEAEETMNPGETVLTSAKVVSSDYAAQVKLNREQVRSKNREVLQAIIDNDSLDEAQKKEAVNEMIQLTDIAEKEANAEMMLEAKGFTNAVVSISEDSCDVVLNMGEVTDARRAQVEDIVKRKTGVAAENIVITPIQ